MTSVVKHFESESKGQDGGRDGVVVKSCKSSRGRADFTAESWELTHDRCTTAFVAYDILIRLPHIFSFVVEVPLKSLLMFSCVSILL